MIWPAIDQAGQLGHFLHAVPGPRLGHALVHHLALPRFHLRGELRLQLVRVCVRVPDSQVGHLGEVAHRLPVAGDGGGDDLAAVPAAEPVAAGRYLHAGGQPLDVPFPRAGRRLIEVVDVEDQEPVGGGEDAEVRQVRIPARLHRQPGHRSTGKVAGHRQRRAAVEGERGHHHPAPPDGHQLRHPRLRLLLQQADRVGPARPRVERRMAVSRHLCPRFLTPLGTLRRGRPVQARLQLIPLRVRLRVLPRGLRGNPARHDTHHRLLRLRFAPHQLGASCFGAMSCFARLLVSPWRGPASSIIRPCSCDLASPMAGGHHPRWMISAPDPGDVSWEPFGGLASASVAAVQAGRLPCVAELDPGFAQLAAQRLIDAHHTELG